MLTAWNKGKTKAEYPQLGNSGVKKGNKPWNKGKAYPAKWLDPYRFNGTNKPEHHREKFSPEERKQIWGNRKGKSHTPETKKKMSLTRKRLGLKTTLGMRWSKESKEKRRNWNLNHREIVRKNGAKGASCFYLRKPTKPEIAMSLKLDKEGVNHIRQYVVNDKFVVDEYLPDKNCIIEVDGVYWHNLEKTKNKDKAENAYLTKCGYKLIRVWETDVSDFSIASI